MPEGEREPSTLGTGPPGNTTGRPAWRTGP